MKIKGIILDVDGTLTDGKKYYLNTPDLTIAKSFSVRDGKGVNLAMKKGIKCCLITADPWELITTRASDMGITDVFYNCHDKITAAQQFCDKYGFSLSEVSFMGDDVNDIPLLTVVAFPVAVGDALPSVKQAVLDSGGIVTTNLGGNGAVREAIEVILERLTNEKD